MIKIFISIITPLIFSLTASAALTENQEMALSDIRHSMEIADAVWSTSVIGNSSNLYLADTFDIAASKASGPSDVWPFTAAIEAHCSLLEALEAVKDLDFELYAGKTGIYRDRLDQLIDNLEYYQGTLNLPSYATKKIWKPYAVPRAGKRGEANVNGILNVYDDQMWLARELIRAYRLTGNEEYLEEATALTDYVLDGWDCWRDENGEEYGGITWGPGYNSKHACSNAPIIQPLVWLYEIYAGSDETVEYYFRDEKNEVTHETRPRAEHYLEFARKVYDWQKDKLGHSSGVYWDMRGADPDIKVKRGYRQHVDCGGPTGQFYSYNTGTMISGGAELFRVTGEDEYLRDLELSAKGALNQFSKYVRKHNTYEFNTDATALNGFNTWFNDVLMRSYVDAYPYVESYYPKYALESFQKNLDYAFENHNHDNMLPIYLLDGWGSETVTKGFHQCAFASEYAMLSVWLLSRESNDTGVSSPIAARSQGNDAVYNLFGEYLGEKHRITDTLPKGIYIIGNKKVMITK